GEVQDRDDEPRLQHPSAGSARADGACARLSALTGVVCVASCKGPRGCRLGVKTVPDRGFTSAQALQPLAQLRQKSPKAIIGRGSLVSVISSPTVDPVGDPALRIRITVTPESTAAISGDAALRTLHEIHRHLQERGEDRFPIIEYATPGEVERAGS